ncbi:Na+/H+ antiporter subunit E [Yimella sp. cx-573]|nr:Na+/H+ antiporter subunit E [Yimella sp. cx-573]
MSAARSRLRFRPAAVFTMAFFWMMLWGSITPVAFLGGVLLGWLVTVVFPLPPVHIPGRPRPWGVLVLGGALLRDLVVSSWHVSRLVWARHVRLRSGIVRVDLLSDHDLYQVQVAELISLVPGTVVVEVVRNPRRLYLHVLDLADDNAIEDIRTMALTTERRVLNAFGTAAERQDFEAACLELRRSHQPVSHEEWEADE